MHSTPTEGVTCLEIIQMKMMMKTSKGTTINHVDGFLGIFNPPPPMWTNVEFRQTPLKNHVDFHAQPPPLLFQKYWNVFGIFESKSSINMTV